MKQLVFNYLKIRFQILGINISNTFNIETAYPAENWANILSTFFYTASYILFLNVIFGNVNSLAGYSYNDMLFFTFVSQLSFYTLFNWSYDNVDALIESIHKGEMDLILTKPLPTLFYIMTRKFSIIRVVRDCVLPLLMIGILIDWSALGLSLISILIGIIIFVCGQWIMHVFQFLLALPAFWQGQSQALLRLSYILTNPNLPLQGLTKFWRIILTTVLPICIVVSGSVSVMIGRSNPKTMVLWALCLALFLTYVRMIAWKKALRAYNSASS